MEYAPYGGLEQAPDEKRTAHLRRAFPFPVASPIPNRSVCWGSSAPIVTDLARGLPITGSFTGGLTTTDSEMTSTRGSTFAHATARWA